MSIFDDDYGRPSDEPSERSTDELRRIVRYQRWLIAVVLAQLTLWLGYVALMILAADNMDFEQVRFPVLFTAILGLIGGLFVFLLTNELRGAFSAVVFGLGTIMPCVGLLIIVLVNGYATTELKKHKIRVGLFGAAMEDVESRPSPYDVDEEEGW